PQDEIAGTSLAETPETAMSASAMARSCPCPARRPSSLAENVPGVSELEDDLTVQPPPEVAAAISPRCRKRPRSTTNRSDIAGVQPNVFAAARSSTRRDVLARLTPAAATARSGRGGTGCPDRTVVSPPSAAEDCRPNRRWDNPAGRGRNNS